MVMFRIIKSVMLELGSMRINVMFTMCMYKLNLSLES